MKKRKTYSTPVSYAVKKLAKDNGSEKGGRTPDLNVNRNSPLHNNIPQYVNTAINLLMAVFTAGLFYLTYRANETSLTSVEIADSVFKETKRYNDSTFTIQKGVFLNDSVESVKRFRDDSISLSLQMETFKTTQQQFYASNRPFLQIGDIVLQPLKVGSPIAVSYLIGNVGKFPAKITNHRINLSIGDLSFVETVSQLPNEMVLLNNIVASGVLLSQPLTFTSYVPLSDAHHRELLDGKKHIYILGDIEYESFLTNQHFKSKVRIRISLNPKFNIRALINSDVEIE